MADGDQALGPEAARLPQPGALRDHGLNLRARQVVEVEAAQKDFGDVVAHPVIARGDLAARVEELKGFQVPARGPFQRGQAELPPRGRERFALVSAELGLEHHVPKLAVGCCRLAVEKRIDLLERGEVAVGAEMVLDGHVIFPLSPLRDERPGPS